MYRTGKILSEKKSRGGEMDMHRFLCFWTVMIVGTVKFSLKVALF